MRFIIPAATLAVACTFFVPSLSDAQSRARFVADEGGLLGEPVHAAPTPPSSGAGDVGAPAMATVSAREAERNDARVVGYSGSLKAVFAPLGSEISGSVAAAVGTEDAVVWTPQMGTRPGGLLGVPVAEARTVTPEIAGIWAPAAADAEPVTDAEPSLFVITQVPFSSKRGAMLNGYHIGRYPTEGSDRTDRYAPPEGFIEVTRENQDFYISENFQLRQFLTKDQGNVWPKYLALDLRLIDKLELVLQELNQMGIRADRMHVMSGFRTPQYNGPGTGGRAQLSRHTYGDGADVWVDNDRNGYMDDLNGDGVSDIADAQVMLRAVERVEAKYPELVGGAGLYVANAAHGPFIHIDVRGTPARW